MSGRPILLLLLAATLRPPLAAEDYRAASLDENGQLHIILASGRELLPPKVRDQVSFDAPAISPDRSTVGWLVMYPDPSIPGDQRRAPLPFALIIYRNGRVLQNFSTQQVFWNWQFQDGGKQVAYSTGPTHGGAAECVLREVASGRILERWFPKEGADPPAWAASLRQ